ncbi:hypothetical protein BaRGS_00014081 [Batillaria attramentaria]|uniref:Uncharacterized protein n=1 Tax=Batillaria attramentaria TaxID=370345 RepID=A0ABD0L5W0_9CAEN
MVQRLTRMMGLAGPHYTDAACCLQNSDAAVKILLSAGASVTAADLIGKTALHTAVGMTHYGLASYLLAHGADINASDQYGLTPLNEAIVNCDVHAVLFLLSHGADVNHVHYRTVSPGHNCSAYDEYTSQFLKTPVQTVHLPIPALQSLLCVSPCQLNCSQCQFRIVRELINAGADVRQIRVKQLVASQHNLQRFLSIPAFSGSVWSEGGVRGRRLGAPVFTTVCSISPVAERPGNTTDESAENLS